ncbi:MAG: DNA repair protein RecO [Bacteroidota bacterium]
MALVKTEGIVLRAMDYRETSKIATIYTKDVGKIRVIAKGIRKQKGGYAGAALDAPTRDAIIFSYREGRELSILTQADILDPYLHLKNRYEAISTAWRIVELVDHSVHDGDPNLSLYQLLNQAFELLNGETKSTENVFYAFEIAFAEVLGFALQLQRCVRCKKKLSFPSREPTTILFSIARGGFTDASCAQHEPAGLQTSPGVVRSLQHLQRDGMSGARRIRLSPSAAREIDGLLSLYLRYHIDELNRVRTKSRDRTLERRSPVVEKNSEYLKDSLMRR